MITRRRSKLHGWGVFATERIPKNKRIIDYAGQKISQQESLIRENRYMKRGAIWCFQINRRWVRDAAVGGNIARFINHSCTGNCYVHIVGDIIWIRAARTIRKGRGADLRLHDRRRRQDQVPLQAGLPAALVELRDQRMRAESSIARQKPRRLSPDEVEAVFQLMRVVEHVKRGCGSGAARTARRCRG